MKKNLRFLFLLMFCLFIFACHNEPFDERRTSRVRFSSVPEGFVYQGAEVYLGDVKLPLYQVKVNTSQVWTAKDYQRIDNGVAYFELDGKVNVKVKVPYEINYKSQLRPLSAGIIPVANISERTLTFEISSSGEYVLEINSDLRQAIHFFVSDYSEELVKPEVNTSIMYFGPGLHTKENNPWIDENNQIRLMSGSTVYLDDGAVIRAKFYASNAENIKIYGRGIIDGSSFERDASNGKATIPIDFNHCRNVTLADFSILDPAGWAINFYFMKNCKIEDLKIITSRSNGDGISLQSCQEIIVDGCFVRTWDDSLVVKNYPRWENRTIQGETRNIIFKDCTLWTDLAQSMEIGYETVGKVMDNIVFENITVLHALHKPVISIHNGNNAEIERVRFENITVEDASMGLGDSHGNDELIDIRVLYSENWSSQHTITSLGSIKDVLVKNVHILSGIKNPKIRVTGAFDNRETYLSKHYVSDINIFNLTYRNQIIDESNANLLRGNYVKNLLVSHDGSILGASFIFSKTEAELSLYNDQLNIYGFEE